ncbi:HD domain-containing protein [Caldanaerobacter subterraneus]|uniref:Metal-dependent phosphohydrolase n=2 Tax=Caldanaerobacter subterraneus TaxID=911092 RepID=U5CMQ5_CALSX|nr:HD domain-containing protein [Caldanaerobacter subterraneus]ERM91288.1 metal-dependent phosphohydrolase [Caldanaerobacter subterraneus subsp. yonseiensis KB-1]TCO67929.1 HD domain-containing protein [Caldanaerobacter subterraneus]
MMPVPRYNKVPSIKVGLSIEEAVKIMASQQSFVLQVINDKGEPVGWLNCLDILKTIIEDSAVVKIKEKSIEKLICPINEEDYLNVFGELSDISRWAEKRGHRLPYFTTTEGNAGILSVSGLLQEALEERDKERELREEAQLHFERINYIHEELEKALANLFIDPNVIVKLKSIVEYQDEYDLSTGKIKITGVIKEGTYLHVVNMLRLLAELWEQGLLELGVINKETLVNATIFHDLGKVQPPLKIGEVVDPKEAFEPGKYHAFRSALIAKNVYHLDKNVVQLIKYHHHTEEELPPDFPDGLLPMHRLFRLIDGLSAGITRRGSKVNLTVKGTIVQVKEESIHPDYNRCIEIDLCREKVSGEGREETC